jgi:hypothetical protein
MSGQNYFELGPVFAEIYEDEVHGPRITEEAFRPIAEKHKIPLSKVEEVRRRLSGGASAYLRAQSIEGAVQRPVSFQDVECQISRVGRLIEELTWTLEHFSEDAKGLFDRVEEDIVSKEIRSEWKTRETSSFGHHFFRNGEGKYYLHRDHIVDHIGALGNMTQHIFTRIVPTNKGGRPRNEAMPRWVDNAYDIWTRTLGHRFSFNQHQGEPTTSAGIFCWETLLLIDPCPNRSKFSTAMRQAVQLNRSGRRRAVEKSQKPAPRTAEDIASTSC